MVNKVNKRYGIKLGAKIYLHNEDNGGTSDAYTMTSEHTGFMNIDPESVVLKNIHTLAFRKFDNLFSVSSRDYYVRLLNV